VHHWSFESRGVGSGGYLRRMPVEGSFPMILLMLSSDLETAYTNFVASTPVAYTSFTVPFPSPRRQHGRSHTIEG